MAYSAKYILENVNHTWVSVCYKGNCIASLLSSYYDKQIKPPCKWTTDSKDWHLGHNFAKGMWSGALVWLLFVFSIPVQSTESSIENINLRTVLLKTQALALTS